MRFSVIIPLYNKAPYVAKAIRSVLAQSFSDYELIVMDDGSVDGSAMIAQQLLERRENAHLIHQENAGVSVARNNGVAASHGEYLCFLDADDWWEPTFLEEMSRLIEQHPDAGIYGTSYYIVKNGKKRVASIGVESDFTDGEINYCRVYAKTLCMPLWTGAVCMPRTMFNEAGGFPKGIALGEDFLLWMHIALKHNVVLLNKPLSNYNQDVDTTYRGTHNKRYDPDSFMTFHLNQYAEEEANNHDLKVLLDRIRVYTLMNFRKYNLFPEKIGNEIAKVDFGNVDPIYKFYYHAPYWMVKMHYSLLQLLSYIKQKLIK